ncbi:hypothetical protein AADZ84_13180 [Colwelliaceae bacterium MEBiC 14330]
MKKIVVLSIILLSNVSYASTWCSFSNFDVVVAKNYVAVHGSTLDAEGKHVFLGNLNTEKGRAIHATLLAAALSKKSIRYGHNNQDFKCGEFPTYSSLTADPDYLSILTKE